MTIAACLIVKDGAATLERAIGSVRPHVDEVCVYDTCSTDGTLELLARLASQSGPPIRVERGEWRDDFAWAREQSFAMASSDWLFWLDDDEELIGGRYLRGALKDARGADTIRLHHTARHPGGVVVTMYRDAIVRRGTAQWRERVHEVLIPDRPDVFLQVNPELVRLIDHSEDRANRPPDHYLRLVELDVAEGSTRALWYLAAIRAAQGDPAGAATALEEFIARPDAPAPLLRRATDALPEARRLARERLQRDTGRNEPCPCGSGVKFKKCHGR